jgi:dolichyl-phosphate-mannose--protein O-mannosyl transferase
LGKAPAPNFEHPLFGKFLIGFGIRIFGNEPFGWRFFPAVFGTLSLLLMGWLAWRFFAKPVLVLLALLFLGFDSMSLLHARLAMLDIFLMTALIGLLLSSYQLLPNPAAWPLRISCALWIAIGLSSKWVFAFAILGFSWSLLFLGHGRWTLRLKTLLAVGLMALGLYHLWYFYYMAHGFSYSDWLEFQLIANTVTTGKLAEHRYGATAFSMLLNSRNIWYYFQTMPDQTVIGLLGLLNPLLIFSISPAIVILWINYRRYRQQQDAFILGWFACCYLPFHLVLMQRQGFLYYMLLLLPIIILAICRMLEILVQSLRLNVLALAYALTFTSLSGFYMPVVLGWPMSQNYYLWLIRFTGV